MTSALFSLYRRSYRPPLDRDQPYSSSAHISSHPRSNFVAIITLCHTPADRTELHLDGRPFSTYYS